MKSDQVKGVSNVEMLRGIARPLERLSGMCESPASGDLFAGVGVTALPCSPLLSGQILL